MLVAASNAENAYNTQDNHIEQGLPGHKVQVTLWCSCHTVDCAWQIRLLEGVFYGEANNGKKEQEHTASMPIKSSRSTARPIMTTPLSALSRQASRSSAQRSNLSAMEKSTCVFVCHSARGEIWLENAHIATYEQGNRYNHEPLRSRKLLLHKREINQLVTRAATKGLTLVHSSCISKAAKQKLELGLCRGKKLYDKRDAIAERDVRRGYRTYRPWSLKG